MAQGLLLLFLKLRNGIHFKQGQAYRHRHLLTLSPQPQSNQTTMNPDTFTQSKAFTIPSKLGLATGYQMAEWLDCLTCIRICCAHELGKFGELPIHWQSRINTLPTGKASLATIVRTLNTWKKWTHQELNATNVQNFLWEISE